MEKKDLIHSTSEILGGIPVFVGTRVPATTLFDYLEDGDSIDEFLIDFPAVSREQVVSFLESLRHETLDLTKRIA